MGRMTGMPQLGRSATPHRPSFDFHGRQPSRAREQFLLSHHC